MGRRGPGGEMRAPFLRGGFENFARSFLGPFLDFFGRFKFYGGWFESFGGGFGVGGVSD